MNGGIFICGLNGAGKSTFGKALADKLEYKFFDIENFYFPDENYDTDEYPRTKTEVEQLLLKEITQYPNFVLASVRGNFSEKILGTFQHVVHIEVPKPIRIERIKKRALQKFGTNALPGGAFYQQEQAFLAFAASRSEDYVTLWLKERHFSPIIIDGTLPIAENVQKVLRCIGAV